MSIGSTRSTPSMATRSAKRQRQRVRQRGHLSRSTLMALGAIACIGLGISQMHHLPAWTKQGRHAFIEWTMQHGFTVQDVQLAGRKQVTSEFVSNAVQIERGMAILSYDPRSAQERLMENPWIQRAKIERRLPHTVFIRMTERVPVARWQVDGNLVLVDASGVALPTDTIENYRHLPIIVGQNARTRLIGLFTLLQAQPEIGTQVVAATWIGNRRWDLTLKHNLVVRLPAENAEMALARLARLAREEKILERDLVGVDLRLPDRAVLQPTIRANALIERPDFSDTPDPSKKNI